MCLKMIASCYARSNYYEGSEWRSFRRGMLLLLLLLVPVVALAHDGPPFPLMVDQKVGPSIISVWTDPDVGTGTFFVIVEAPPGTEIPADLQVQVAVQPASGRLAEVTYPASREFLKGQVQYKALVQFDSQELWRVRVRLQSAQGSGEAMASVEATPPGYGRWDLLVYVAPFLAVALLWLLALFRRHTRRTRIPDTPKASN